MAKSSIAILDSAAEQNPQFIKATTFIVCKLWHKHIHALVLGMDNLHPLYKYINRVISNSQSTVATVAVALFFVNKLRVLNPDLGLGKNCEAKVFTVALMLASKVSDDVTYNGKTWSRITNFSPSQLCSMEIEFLYAVKHDLHISKRELNEWNFTIKEVSKIAARCHPLDYNEIEFKLASHFEEKKSNLPKLIPSPIFYQKKSVLYKSENLKSLELNNFTHLQ